MAKLTLSPQTLAPIRAKLKKANLAFVKSYPGTSPARQPVHVVYGGAQLFKSDTPKRVGELALEALEKYAPDASALARALGEPEGSLWERVYPRVIAKLKREAVEDYRIDFEDGYGNRPWDEEDAHAESVAREVAQGYKAGTISPFIGIRIKPLNEELAPRSLRTLDLFITTLVRALGKLPEGFLITLPKITVAEQSRALAQTLAALEKKLKLNKKSLIFEIMVEVPQAVLNDEGVSPLRSFVDAGEGRCIAAHFGTYDYTAGCGITASHQAMGNPVCDFAKHVMQVTFAGTPILLSDGATNVMPIGDAGTVHRAWRLSYSDIRRSLRTGFYQGWDLHPNQLPVRYAAVYAFFLESLEPASARLRMFIDKAAKATLLGEVFDDAATGQGLLGYFLRGIASGAVTEEEALATGLTLEEFRGRSFLKIIETRTRSGG
jgi:citrate lyase beta subunit